MMIAPIVLRLVAVVVTAVAENLVVMVAERHCQLALDGRPLPYLTQPYSTGGLGFRLRSIWFS